jgi:hypothetical protein
MITKIIVMIWEMVVVVVEVRKQNICIYKDNIHTAIMHNKMVTWKVPFIIIYRVAS